LSSRAGIPQRPFAAVFLGDVAASDQFGPVAFCFQSLDQCLDVGGEVLLVRLCRHVVHTTGRTFVQVSPAVQHQFGIQTPIEVPKTVVFAGLRPQCYSPQ